MLYRIKQFIWALTSNFKRIDYNIIDKYLDIDEKNEFLKLSKADRHHSIRVCNDSIKGFQSNKNKVNLNKLGKLTLLHDIGKAKISLNIIDKSLLVLVDKFTKGKVRKYSNIKKIDAYYNHGEYGYKILKEKNKYDDDFLNAVRYHHKNKNNKNIYKRILCKYDNKN